MWLFNTFTIIFYILNHTFSGCSCDLGGSVSQSCDQVSGKCECKPGLQGRDCDRPADGQFVPSLYHIKGNLVLDQSISSLKVRDHAKMILYHGVYNTAQ